MIPNKYQNKKDTKGAISIMEMIVISCGFTVIS